MSHPLSGKWRIVETDLWDADYLDLVEPASIPFDGPHGELVFGVATLSLDCECSPSIVFFTFHGFDEGTEVTGQGSPELDDNGNLSGEFSYHLGDEASFKAKKC